MNLVELIEKEFKNTFNAIGIGDYNPNISIAKNPKFGDYQVNGVMNIAKQKKINPIALANQIISSITNKNLFSKLEIAGPGFINIILNPNFLIESLNNAYQNENLLINKILLGKKIILDYSGPNLAKEMHVGHLRSTIIGDSIHRILKFLGANVIPQNHVGDWGTQFGMLVANLSTKKNYNNSDFVLSDLESFYREAKVRFDEDNDFADFSRKCVVDLQSKKPEIMLLWKSFVSLSLKHMQDIYSRLGILLSLDDVKGESLYNDGLESIVEELLDKKIAIDDDGTKIVFIKGTEDKNGNLSVFVIRKKDGSFLYSTTDLTCLKENIFSLSPNKILYVVDSRQSLHFKALFQIAKDAKWINDDIELKHIEFGTIMSKDGKPFKTREGDTVKLIQLIEEAKNKALKLIKSRNNDFDDIEMEKIADIIGIGAIKYADLSKNRISDYIFDLDKMIAFDGNTAPYLQYAYTRIQSLINKEIDNKDINRALFALKEDIEYKLAVAILQFEETLNKCIESYNPHYLANYLYDLANLFSKFYEICPILNQEELIKLSRLRLAKLVGIVLKSGLYLLGIEVLTRM